MLLKTRKFCLCQSKKMLKQIMISKLKIRFMRKNLKNDFARIISIISFILGAISIYGGWLNLGVPGKLLNIIPYGEDKIIFIYFRIFFPLSLIGLILGILGFKLKIKRVFAILGIILSLIGLIIWLFVWFWIIGWTYA